MSLHLAQRVSPISDIPHSLALNGVAYTTLTPSKTMLVFWRFEDEGNKEPQFLAAVPVDKPFDWTIDLKGRVVELWGISVTEKGVPRTKHITEGVYVRFDPGAAAIGPEDTVIAGENLDENELVYLYLESGTTKAKKADADDATKPCQAFVVDAAAVTNDPVRIFLSGNTMTGLTGRTPGSIQYLSTTAGQMTETPPATTGNFVQQIGVAVSSTSVTFHPLTGSIVPGGGGGSPPGGSPPSALLLTDNGASGGNEDIDLDWTNNGGTGDNIIERNLDGAGYAELDRVAFNVATYNDLAPIAGGGLLVYYRVRNASVIGYSNEVGIDGTGGTPPSDLTVSKSLLGECIWDVHLSWTAGSGSGNFTVQIKVGAGGTWNNISTSVSGTTYDDEEGGSSGSYVVYYRVKRNSITGWSNEASTTIPRCFE